MDLTDQANNTMKIIKMRKIFLMISLGLVLASLVITAVQKPEYSIEFTGGSVIEASYETRPDVDEVRTVVLDAGFEARVQPFGDDSYIVRTGFVTEEERKALIGALTSFDTSSEIERFNIIGPSVGKELKTKSLYALIFVSLGIVLFVAYAFRHVSKPVSSWKYGLVAVIALLHDIIIPIGILSLIGTEIDTLYVVGLLSILGLSVNDTIVVFDRIRENLKSEEESNTKTPFTEVVGRAINDTVTRSIMTSLTLVVVLLGLYIWGPVATQTLALVLLLGTIVGTYSSIFLASPLLTIMVSKKSEE